MAILTCPFCGASIPLARETYTGWQLMFTNHKKVSDPYTKYYFESERENALPTRPAITVHIYHCPDCERETFSCEGISGEVQDVCLPIYPNSRAKKYPNFVPEHVRQDYEEAYAIITLSPKASATLSRRCLQGMIRDFWKITGKKNLHAEIEAIKQHLDQPLIDAILGLKSIGNIGAHPDIDISTIVDVDPSEAKMLLDFIELLIDKWYIARNKEETLLANIANVADAKKTPKP